MVGVELAFYIFLNVALQIAKHSIPVSFTNKILFSKKFYYLKSNKTKIDIDFLTTKKI